MDSLSLFTLHLDGFLTSHGLSQEIGPRMEKFIEEARETVIAYHMGTEEELKGELLDVLITTLAALRALDVKEPLFAAYLKLQEVANRPAYKELREQKKPCFASCKKLAVKYYGWRDGG